MPNDDITDWLISREESIKFESKEEELKSSLLKQINKLDMNKEETTIILKFISALLDLHSKGGSKVESVFRTFKNYN